MSSFSYIDLLPFCITKDLKTQYAKPTGQINVTNSTIDTNEKSAKFFWMLKRLTIETVLTFLDFDGNPLNLASETTITYYREWNGEEHLESQKPADKACGAYLGYPIPPNVLSLSQIFSFYESQKTNLHFECPLRFPNGPYPNTPNVAFLGLTSLDADFGFTFNTTPPITYDDFTIPITFDDFTLYVKLVSSNVSLSEAFVLDYEFYDI